MKILKLVLIIITVYVGIVVLFESLLGYFQPQGQTTLTIMTEAEDGKFNSRVLQQITSQGQIYVAANHWPRAWYHDALAKPDLKATIAGKTANYHATEINGSEHDKLMTEFAHPIWFRILTGFPTRKFVRLDPR